MILSPAFFTDRLSTTDWLVERICETEPGPNGENPVQLDLETIITLAHAEILLALKELESDDPAS